MQVSEALYVEDVFSTFLFTAKSGATENGDMVNGINLADEGGMVWIKDRTELPIRSFFN